MIDPITLEIIEGTIESAVTEIEAAIERTAMSTMIREQHDFRVAIYDARGNAVSRVSFAATIDPIYEAFAPETIGEGDVILYNDVYRSHGGITHLPDMCVNIPVFHEGVLLGWVQSFGHVEDIGGIAVGSMPTIATSIHHEGLMIPPVKLYESGRLNQALYEVILRNSRFPASLRGDIDAEVAACRMGATRLTELCRRYGRETVAEAFERLLARCEHAIRSELLPQIPDGAYVFEDFVGYDGVVPDRPYKIRIAMTKDAAGLRVAFDGTSGQATGPVNFAASPKFYAKFLGSTFKPFLPGLVLNEGVTRVFHLEEPPKGSLLNPRFPAPVCHRTVTMVRVLDTFQGVMARALPQRVAAAMDTITLFTIHGAWPDGRPFFFREIVGAGSGGRNFADGLDAVDMVPESKNIPTEFAEMVYPLEIEQVALRRDSGGPGTFRGGHGYVKDVRILADVAYVSIRECRSGFANWGLEGGRAGEVAKLILNPDTPGERHLPGLVQDVAVRRGDRIRVITAGGGGWGDPLRRSPTLVLDDVRRRLISAESARVDYGVVLDAPGGPVDEAVTGRLREEMAAKRGPSLRIDRGEYAATLRAQGVITYDE